MSLYHTAGKDPAIIAVNRLMARGKAVVAKYLTDQTGATWDASDKGFEDSFLRRVTFRFWVHRDPNEEARGGHWYVKIEFYHDKSTGAYRVDTSAEKGTRTVAHDRVEGLSLDDLRRVTNFIRPDFIKTMKLSMSGSYAREKAEIADHVAKVAGLIAEIQQKAAKLDTLPVTEATVEDIAETVEALRWDCASVDSQVGYIRELREIIAKGQ